MTFERVSTSREIMKYTFICSVVYFMSNKLKSCLCMMYIFLTCLVKFYTNSWKGVLDTLYTVCIQVVHIDSVCPKITVHVRVHSKWFGCSTFFTNCLCVGLRGLLAHIPVCVFDCMCACTCTCVLVHVGRA